LERKLFRGYNPDVDLFISVYWIDYKYNDAGCLIEETKTYNRIDIGTGVGSFYI